MWIVDAKKYKGRIEVATKLFSDNELIVAGRKKPKLVEGLHRQHNAVIRAFASEEDTPAIHMVLCFVDGDFPLFGSVGQVNGVHVVSSNSVMGLITKRESAGVDVERVAATLDQQLPTA